MQLMQQQDQQNHNPDPESDLEYMFLIKIIYNMQFYSRDFNPYYTGRTRIADYKIMTCP